MPKQLVTFQPGDEVTVRVPVEAYDVEARRMYTSGAMRFNYDDDDWTATLYPGFPLKVVKLGESDGTVQVERRGTVFEVEGTYLEHF